MSPSWDLIDGSVGPLVSYLGGLNMGGSPSLWVLECMLAVGDLISIFKDIGVAPEESRGDWVLWGL
jgi:hypothetical protein